MAKPPSGQKLSPFWLPFTPNRHFSKHPRILTQADGMYYTADDGRQILDATAGLWCVNAGHGRAHIADAIAAQARKLDYAPSFQFSHPGAFALAERIATIAPQPLNHVFFCNSGSEAVDTALKIALACQQLRGQGQRTRLIGRERGYHGTGFGGISVGGLVNNRNMFGPLLPGTDHLPHTYHARKQAFSRGEPEWGVERADALEDLVALHGADTIAAVIVEPVAGSTGVLAPPQGYLQRLREICTRHGILLIFDEVITGFGRLGSAFGATRFSVTPDMITFAKGVTNGAVPLGGVLVSDEIHAQIVSARTGLPDHGIELFHGYTYSGHPLAMAAGEATLDLYVQDNLFARAAALETLWADAIHTLCDLGIVRDIRTIGLAAGIDIDPSENPGARGFQALQSAFHAHDMMIRITGDTIALSPPLIIREAEITLLAERLRRLLQQLE